MDSKIGFYIKEAEEALSNKPVIPITCEIDPTTICQNDCYFCINKESNKSSHSILDLDIYDKLIDDLYSLGIKSITFTGGGEPLLHPKFDELVIKAKNRNIKIGLITNGIYLDKYIRLLPQFEFIRISLYGTNSDSYYSTTSRDHFNKVIENIKLAVKYKRELHISNNSVTLGISYVLSEDSNDINNANDLAESLGVDYIQFKPILKTNLPNIIVRNKSIVTQRYIAENNKPCMLAGLIGIVSADANVYYCCIKRGDKKYCLGNLKYDNFINLWKKRIDIIPDYKECYTCRYVNYVKGLESIPMSDRHFLKHRDFL